MSDQRVLSNTKFALVGVDREVGTIKGFALCYENAGDARLFFEHVHKYLTTSAGGKQFQVEFTSNPANASAVLHITIAAESISVDCTITDLSLPDVLALVENLRNFKYYFIVAGHYSQGSFSPLPPENYHIFKADMWLNGERILSSTDAKWPTRNPFTKPN